jgi:CMP-N,N'-diacetyllegionaminic acid synthase
MKNIAIIPARGGSKGIPNKNIIDLCGKPLIQYSIEAALNSQLDKVVVSSDCENILNIAASLGAATLKRPAELSTDNSSTLDTVLHLLSCTEEAYDNVMILQPTSPLRTSQDIDKALKIFSDKDADSLVSVVKVPHNMTPESLMRMNHVGELTHYLEGERCYRRQDKTVYYARNGAAIYISKISCIKDGILNGKIIAYEMPFLRSFDIDEVEDLDLLKKFMAF